MALLRKPNSFRCMSFYRSGKNRVITMSHLRLMSAVADVPNLGNIISMWQLSEYNGFDSLSLAKIPRPIISDPNKVIVKVRAASVNPIDVAMTYGYGSSILNLFRKNAINLSEFPITTGRDFAGEVILTGCNVEEYKPGDQVYGFISPHDSGSHCEEILVSKCQIAKKPEKLSMLEAASIPYAAMTAWSALKITGGLAITGAKGRNTLVLGGAGGVGTLAVQLLKAWDSCVSATASPDALPLIESLNVSHAIDYTRPDLHEKLSRIGKFDLILDCAGLGAQKGTEYLQHLKDYSFAKYVTLTTPLLRNSDESGLIAGLIKSAAQILAQNAPIIGKTSSIRWAFFVPIPQAWSEINQICLRGKIQPCLHATFPFDELPSAFKAVKNGHLRGKIVIDMTSNKDV